MNGPIVFRDGRIAPDPSRPRLTLAAHWVGGIVPASRDSVDYVTPAAPYLMDGNASWGDCAEADPAHHIHSVTTLGDGENIQPSEADCLAAYSEITGFDPNAGPPGDNPTDQGSSMQDVQNWWRKNGLFGHKSAAFAEVDHTNLPEVYAAIDLFGGIDVGINFPQSAMGQFNAGQPWDVVHGSPIEGGHAIHVGGYDKATGEFILTTWGAVQRMTMAFWKAYVEEVWVPVLSEFVDPKTGKTPEGLDLVGLGAAFASLTGDPNPFPAPTPIPVPVPPAPVPPGPAPTPVPVPPVPPVDRDAALTAWAGSELGQRFLTHHHSLPMDRAAQTALQAWLAGATPPFHYGPQDVPDEGESGAIHVHVHLDGEPIYRAVQQHMRTRSPGGSPS